MNQNLSVDPPFSQTPSPLESSPLIHEEKIDEIVYNEQIPFYKKPRFLITAGTICGVLGILFIVFAIITSSKIASRSDTLLSKDKTDTTLTSSSDYLGKNEVITTATPAVSPNRSAKPQSTATPKPTAKATFIPTPTVRPTPTPTPNYDFKIDNAQVIVQNGFLGSGHESYPTTPEPEQVAGYQVWYERPGTDPFYVSYTISNLGRDTAVHNTRVITTINGNTVNDLVFDNLKPSEPRTTNLTLPKDPGTYELKVMVNPNRSLPETSYDNNEQLIKYIIKQDDVAPKIYITTFRDNTNKKTCVEFDAFDNVSLENQITTYGKMDGGEWQRIYRHPDPSQEAGFSMCLSGSAGESHTFAVKASDNRNNTSELNYPFTLHSF